MATDPDPTKSGPEELRPVAPWERIETIDAVRGFAILGILLVNVGAFSFPERYLDFQEQMFSSTADRVVRWAIAFLVEGKIYTMFSFLFGLGIAVQAERAAARGRRFGVLHVRRLVALLAIGVAHDLLLWNGRILIAYAILGFLVLPFVRRKPRTLLVWAAALLLLPVLALPAVRLAVAPPPPPAGIEQDADAERQREEREQERRQAMEEEILLFREGAYADMVRHRVGALALALRSTLMFGSYMLAAFLLGIWTWKTRVFQDLDRHLGLVRKVLVWGALVGVAGNVVFALARQMFEGSSPPSAGAIAVVVTAFMFGNPALCLAYVAVIVLLARRPAMRSVLSPVRAAGRLTLSGYVLQSVLCTTLFYSYGFGWYGKTGPAVNLLLVLAVATVHLALAAWWARRFRFGPVEWFWRLLTYGKPPRIRTA